MLETQTELQKPNFEAVMAGLDQKAQYDQMLDQEQKEQEAIEKAKKNHNFVQFTRPGLLKLSKLKNGLALQIIMWLAKEMDQTASIVISQQTLADIFEVRRETVNQAIKELVNHEIVKIIKSGNTSIICLNASVVWNTYRTNLKLARFNATVIVSSKEQKELTKTKLKTITKKADQSDE